MPRRSDHFPKPIRPLLRWVRQQFDPHSRAVAAARRRFPGEMLQPFGTTSEDRHPALFAEIKRQLAGHAEPRLLSFGCSTGEEALTLHRYLPMAKIDAIDLNGRAIAIATRRVRTDRISFSHRGDPPGKSYDAILCLSVLRHGGLDEAQPESCAAILPFSSVDALLQKIDVALKPGGLLAIWGSNFLFSQSSIAARYVPLDVPGMVPERGAFYGADNFKLPLTENRQFLFRKLAPNQT